MQSAVDAPEGRTADEHGLQFVPIMTLPVGHRHLEEFESQDIPFVQTQPKELPSPLA